MVDKEVSVFRNEKVGFVSQNGKFFAKWIVNHGG